MHCKNSFDMDHEEIQFNVNNHTLYSKAMKIRMLFCIQSFYDVKESTMPLDGSLSSVCLYESTCLTGFSFHRVLLIFPLLLDILYRTFF